MRSRLIQSPSHTHATFAEMGNIRGATNGKSYQSATRTPETPCYRNIATDAALPHSSPPPHPPLTHFALREALALASSGIGCWLPQGCEKHASVAPIPSKRHCALMASTYALPVNPTTQTYSHGHSRSHYLSDHQPAWGNMNGHSHAGGSHRHHHSELNGQLRGQEPSPYSENSHYSHDHTHDRSNSRDSSYTLKPFMSGRPRGRPRGESDLGRPPSRKSAKAGKFGFSPIQEAPAPPPTYVSLTVEEN